MIFNDEFSYIKVRGIYIHIVQIKRPHYIIKKKTYKVSGKHNKLSLLLDFEEGEYVLMVGCFYPNKDDLDIAYEFKKELKIKAK